MWWNRNASSSSERERSGLHELLLDQRAEALAHAVANALGQEMRHGVLDEDLPDDRGRLDHGSLVRLEVVEARREQRVDRRRHDGAVDVRGRRASCPRSKRMSPSSMSIETSCSTKSGFPSEASTTRARMRSSRPALPSRCSVIARVSSSVRRSSSIRVAPGDGGPLGMALEELVARRADHEQRRVLGCLEDVLDEVEEARLGPVDVLEEDDERSRPGERLQQLPCPPDELLAGELRRARGRSPTRRAPPPRRRPRAPRASASATSVVSRSRMPAACRTASASGQKVMPSPYGRQRPRRKATCVERADELVDEPRLADARLADHGHEPAAPLRRWLRAAGAFSAASSSSRPTIGASSRRGRSAPSRTATSRYAGTGSDLPLSSSGSTSSTSTKSRTRRYVRSSEEHLLLARGLLEPGGDVHGVPGDEALVRGRVAGDDLPGVHAGADREPHAPVALELVVERHPARAACPRRRERPGGRRPRGASAGRRRP